MTGSETLDYEIYYKTLCSCMFGHKVLLFCEVFVKLLLLVYARFACCFAKVSMFAISNDTVTAPTPPGTGE